MNWPDKVLWRLKREEGWSVTIGIAALQCGIALLGLLARRLFGSSPVPIWAWSVLLPTVVGLQALHSAPNAEPLRTGWRLGALGLQALLTYLSAFVFGVHWPGMGGFVAGSALTTIPYRRLGWAVFALLAAGSWVVAQESYWPPREAALTAGFTAFVGLGVAALLRLGRRLSRIHWAQAAVARGAAQDERVRIARDLHDMLATRLTVAILRGEMADRYVGVQDDRAHSELRDMVSLARTLLTDVRSMAYAYGDLSLSYELDNSRRVLGSAGIAVVVADDGHAPGSDVERVLAIALCEGVVNLLRHSRATCCHITISSHGGWTELSVHNDGVERAVRSHHPHGGRGLGNLASRASAVGGVCRASSSGDGWFQLTVACPDPEWTASRTAANPSPDRSGRRQDDCERRVS